MNPPELPLQALPAGQRVAVGAAERVVIAAADKAAARGQDVGPRAAADLDFQHAAVVTGLQIVIVPEAQLRRAGRQSDGRRVQLVHADARRVGREDGVGRGIIRGSGGDPGGLGAAGRSGPPRRQSRGGDAVEVLGEDGGTLDWPSRKEKVTVPRFAAPSCNWSEAVLVPPQLPVAVKVNGWTTAVPLVLRTP